MGATIDDLASAIARFEGFGTPGVWATINNNPGNLRSGPGQIGTNGGFAVFATPADGYAALDKQIQTNESLGLNLNQFFGGEPGVYAGYAPAADSNNPAQYATTVAGWLGIDPTVPLTQELSGSSTPTYSVATDSSDSDPLGLSDIASTIDSFSLPDSLDLSAATGLSWPALAGIAGGLIVVVYAFRR